MYRHKRGARWEYREQQGQRVRDSASLADTFKQLKSLTVDLRHCDPNGVTQGSQVKYVVNLANARSVFRFTCPNDECVGGDFDLTEDLATAVTKHNRSATGKHACQGWRRKTTVDTVHCHNILRYKLTLAY